MKPEFNKSYHQTLKVGDKDIFVFDENSDNIDPVTVASFGEEWTKFDSFNEEEIQHVGNEYFDIVPDVVLNPSAKVLDVGCGTGRWTAYVAPKVGHVDAMDPSKAVLSAAQLLKDQKNVRILQSTADQIPVADATYDLVFSLGVLHHIPDTAKALKDVVKKVKQDGACLIYLYYALDNRSWAYRALFHTSTLFRRMISKMPKGLKKVSCDLIAIGVYMPFVLLARSLRAMGIIAYQKLPLAYYADKSFNIIRNDSLDRFGTPLEQRFTKEEVRSMMEDAGLKDIVFSEKMPCWHAIGYKR